MSGETDTGTRPSKSQRAYELIKSRIAAGRYGPGYRLVLGTLARELEVSTVPVREAVRMLEAEGFVEFERNVGAQVAAINPVEYQHTMQTLAIVEGAATGLAAAEIAPETIDAAHEINERMRSSLRDFDPVAFTELNHEFHETLYRDCPNPHLLDLVRREWTRMRAIRESTFSFVPGRSAESVDEHTELLTMLREGAEAETVERAAREHRMATMHAYFARENGSET